MKKVHIRGNALFMILIAIFLLGAVTALIARSSGTTEETGNTEKLTIEASKVLRYSANIGNAWQQLLVRGCSEGQITFEYTGMVEDYTNPNAPTDESCHIFAVRGSGQTAVPLNQKFIGSGVYAYGGRPVFYSGSGVKNFGTTKADLIMNYNDIPKDLCMAINTALGITNPSSDAPTETQDSLSATLHKGTFSGTITDFLGDNVAITDKKAGCIKRTDLSNIYQFYYLLYAR